LRASLIQHAKQTGERPRLPEIDQQARALLAGREIRQTLSMLTAAGVDAQYIKLDISKRRSVQAAMAKLTQAHGPITGLVHGAGVLADRQAIKKTKADLTKVFAPKVEGLLNILASIDVSALTHLGLFSSAAAVFGNPGQSDYAMANAWLNNVADQLNKTHKHLRVKSFCWGPWAGGMVDDTLAAHFAERGIELIELQDGAEIFAKHLLYGKDDVVNLLVGDRW
jgi:NADP-dependent 3-hydroxy acid dehydrogenase YdfG